MGEVKVQGHKVCPTSYHLTFLLFHVNRPSCSFDMAFSEHVVVQHHGHITLTLEFKGQILKKLYLQSP